MKSLAVHLIHWILFVWVLQITEADQCYRKVKVKRSRVVCRGPLKRVYPTIRACCTSRRGLGFSLTKVRLGKNLYKCSSCRSIGYIKSRKARPRTKVDKKTLKGKSKGGWGEWGACSATCGAGWRRRVRLCLHCDLTDAVNYQIHPCLVAYYCPVHGNWGPWQPWYACSKSCERGIQIRHRHCNYPAPSHGGRQCDGEARQERDCNPGPCHVGGGWGSWGQFGACTVTCGRGTRTRTRLCNSASPISHGQHCSGSKYQQRRCNMGRCPPPAKWSTWGEWGLCSATCGEGTRSRKRTCTRLGACPGTDTDDQGCYSGTHCPEDGGWGGWTSYSPCSARTCTGERGFQIRTRTCTNPQPRYGGNFCRGTMFSAVSCVNQDGCLVNGSWCEWSAWSSCVTTCRSSPSNQVTYTRRSRVCECPVPKHGGNACSKINGTRSFELKICPASPPCDNDTTPDSGGNSSLDAAVRFGKSEIDESNRNNSSRWAPCSMENSTDYNC